MKIEERMIDFEPDVWYYGKYHTDGSCYMKGAREHCQMLLDEIVNVENYGQERARKKMGDISTDILISQVKENPYIVGN